MNPSSLRDLEWFVTEADRRAVPAGGTPLRERLGTLRLDDVSFSYPDRDEPALSGVSLTIEAGTVVALVGENGPGKSPLVKLLSNSNKTKQELPIPCQAAAPRNDPSIT